MQNRSRAANEHVALAVLAFLDEQPRHPYEIQKEIRERHKEFAAGKPRGLYHAVDRLPSDGLIEPLETNREGKRPERTIYRITEDGQEELQEWISDLLSRPIPEWPAYAVGLSFAAYLSAAKFRERLQERALALEAGLASRQAARRALEEQLRLPRAVLLELECAIALSRAELEWTRGLIEELRNGQLSWSREELAKRFEELDG